MPVNQDRIQRMRDYGLTEYQARVYLALLDLGSTPAAPIPAISRVPRSRVYSILQELNEKGLTQVLPERPLRYKPVPLATYLREVVQEQKKRAKLLEASLPDVAREFSVSRDVLPSPRGRFEAIYGRRNVSLRTDEMYGRASHEILGIGTGRSPYRLVRALGTTLREKTRAGVSVRYAFHVAPENQEDVRVMSGYAQVRSIDFPMPVVLHGVDGREFLLSHPIPDDNSPNRGEDIAIWTDDPAIATAMLRIAKRIWNTGLPLSTAPPTGKHGSRIRKGPRA
jgi:sugar-specific transcriptional regulator TrmB